MNVTKKLLLTKYDITNRKFLLIKFLLKLVIIDDKLKELLDK